MKELLKILKESQPSPVAIFGAGISGQGVKHLLDKMGWENQIFDEQGRVFEKADARNCSIVVYSPGFKPGHPWFKKAKTENKLCLSELDFGSLFLSDQKVTAITGTNGKSSVTTLLHQVSCNHGVQSVAGGNLGIPLCELLAQGVESNAEIFLEVSSFQSSKLVYFKPDGVIWTNFTPDHLDHHGGLKEYFLAKYNLMQRAGFRNCLVGRSVADACEDMGIKLPESVVVVDPLIKGQVPYEKDHFLVSYPQLENLALSKYWFQQRGMKVDTFFQLAFNYIPERHRLQCIGKDPEGPNFWNDSKSTNLASALAACKNFAHSLFWIGGGGNKGESVKDFALRLKPYITRAFLYGETGGQLHKELRASGCWSMLCESLKDAVHQSFCFADQNTDILFSPGFCSFDQFKNYEERGKSFEKLVLDLKKIIQKGTPLSTQSFALQTGR